MKPDKNPNLNKKYGLTKAYHHDLDEKGVCKKCHRPVRELEGKLKLCSVIGREEVSNLRNPDEW